mmetsp:Transcript_82942/g.261988  ORF Transcript_82942/g.261988 Transcript_82942/m.261988 type:complete len:482 (-) Transcript_82942:633-2078(-)
MRPAAAQRVAPLAEVAATGHRHGTAGRPECIALRSAEVEPLRHAVARARAERTESSVQRVGPPHPLHLRQQVPRSLCGQSSGRRSGRRRQRWHRGAGGNGHPQQRWAGPHAQPVADGGGEGLRRLPRELWLQGLELLYEAGARGLHRRQERGAVAHLRYCSHCPCFAGCRVGGDGAQGRRAGCGRRLTCLNSGSNGRQPRLICLSGGRSSCPPCLRAARHGRCCCHRGRGRRPARVVAHGGLLGCRGYGCGGGLHGRAAAGAREAPCPAMLHPAFHGHVGRRLRLPRRRAHHHVGGPSRTRPNDCWKQQLRLRCCGGRWLCPRRHWLMGQGGRGRQSLRRRCLRRCRQLGRQLRSGRWLGRWRGRRLQCLTAARRCMRRCQGCGLRGGPRPGQHRDWRGRPLVPVCLVRNWLLRRRGGCPGRRHGGRCGGVRGRRRPRHPGRGQKWQCWCRRRGGGCGGREGRRLEGAAGPGLLRAHATAA